MLILIGFTVIWLFVGCQQKTIQNSFTSLSICDVNEIRETRTINLSEWVEDFQIIRFENSDTALFRMKSVAITDNYIGICQHGQNAFKLFDRKGNFLCDVGQPGGGVDNLGFRSRDHSDYHQAHRGTCGKGQVCQHGRAQWYLAR